MSYADDGDNLKMREMYGKKEIGDVNLKQRSTLLGYVCHVQNSTKEKETRCKCLKETNIRANVRLHIA